MCVDVVNEHVLLAAAMVDPVCLDRLANRLAPHHFLRPEHAAAWEAILRARREGLEFEGNYATQEIEEMASVMRKLFTVRDIILKVIIPSASPIIFAGLRLGISAGFIGAILSELKITPTGVGDIITYSRSIADYPSMYAAIFSIILLAVLFLNLLEKAEHLLFKGNVKGYVSD